MEDKEKSQEAYEQPFQTDSHKANVEMAKCYNSVL